MCIAYAPFLSAPMPMPRAVFFVTDDGQHGRHCRERVEKQKEKKGVVYMEFSLDRNLVECRGGCAKAKENCPILSRFLSLSMFSHLLTERLKHTGL